MSFIFSDMHRWVLRGGAWFRLEAAMPLGKPGQVLSLDSDGGFRWVDA